MSIQALNWALSLNEIDSSPARFILMILCNYANEDNESYPSIETIAKRTSLSVMCVKNKLSWLEENGYLVRHTRRRNGKKATNLYKILLETSSVPSLEETIEDEVEQGTHDEKLGTRGVYNPRSVPDPNPDPDPKDQSPDKDLPHICKVFDHWKEKFKHPLAKLDPKRAARIRARLKRFSPDDLILALNGAALSPWHLGENPAGTKYDGISTLLRDNEQVEKFIELSKQQTRVQAARVVPPVSTVCDLCSPTKLCMFHDPHSTYHTNRRGANAKTNKNI